MAEFKVTVDGVEREALLNSFEIKEVVNGVNILAIELDSANESPLYRSDPNTEIIVEDVSGSPVTRRYAGLISNVHESMLLSEPDDSILNRIDAGDFSVYTERRYVTTVIPAGTLKAAVIVLVAYLTPYGVTLDAGQVTGPSLPEVTFDQMRVDGCFNYLANLTSGFGTPYVWNIDYDKVLSFSQVGSETCPFNLIEGVGTEKGDVEVDVPASSGINTVTLIYGSTVVVTITQPFVGNGVDSTFVLDYAIAGAIPFIDADNAVGYAVVDINGFESLGGLTSGLLWTYNPATLEITRVAGPPTNLQAFSIRYDVQFPQVVTVSNLGSPPDPIWETQVKNTQIHDKTQATDYATALLDQEQSTLKTVTYTTLEEGARPGQVQTITVPKRALSGSFLITEVVTRQLVPKGEVSSVITAVGGDTFRGSFRDLYRDWLRDDVGNASVDVAGSGGVPSLPIRSIQFNRGGTFGGVPYALLDEDGSGDIYGVEVAPAMVAIGTATEEISGGANNFQQLVIFNAAAGLDKALTFWQLDDGTQYIEHDVDGANRGINIYEWGAASGIEIDAANGPLELSSGAASLGYSITLGGYVRLLGLGVGVNRFTGTTYTPSTNAIDTVLIFGGTSACTVTLPDLASFVGGFPASGVDHSRIMHFVNDGTADLILDPTSTQVIGNASGAGLTLTLLPGQSAIIGSYPAGTGVGWKVLGGVGVLGVGSALLQVATVPLTDAQIKALPTTAIALVAAPGAGFRVKPISATLVGNFTAGAYTNVNAVYSDLHFRTNPGGAYVAYPLANDNTLTTPIDRLSTFLGASDFLVDVLFPYPIGYDGGNAAGTAGYILSPLTHAVGAYNNDAIEIAIDNNGSGALTGGNAANTLLVKVYYVVEAL